LNEIFISRLDNYSSYNHDHIIKLVKVSQWGGGRGCIAPAALPAVYSPVRCVLYFTLILICYYIYYNKWRNISLVACHLHYSVPFKKNTKCESSFFRRYMYAIIIICPVTTFKCLIKLGSFFSSPHGYLLVFCDHRMWYFPGILRSEWMS
jgi:hypothetical protein